MDLGPHLGRATWQWERKRRAYASRKDEFERIGRLDRPGEELGRKAEGNNYFRPVAVLKFVKLDRVEKESPSP